MSPARRFWLSTAVVAAASVGAFVLVPAEVADVFFVLPWLAYFAMLSWDLFHVPRGCRLVALRGMLGLETTIPTTVAHRLPAIDVEAVELPALPSQSKDGRA